MLPPLVFAILGCAVLAVGCAAPMREPRLLHTDDFKTLDQWNIELEQGGSVTAKDGAMDIDVGAGATIWFLPELSGPVEISYEATALRADPPGPNDRVSDLNCFWMATDPQSPADLFAKTRSGAFADYHALRCYYASVGGNGNTTTRFRRYIGSPTTRPLRPEHDLTSPLLEPNVPVQIRLVANGPRVQFYRDDRLLFDFVDVQPYTRGRFAIRTVASHLRIRTFRVRVGSVQRHSFRVLFDGRSGWR